jgi:selenocysteine lyase/cysteine desulfurase
MKTRRDFLATLTTPAVGAAIATRLQPRFTALAPGLLSELAAVDTPPEPLAADESFWSAVQQAFAIDRSMINLNNGGVSPAPAMVIEAFKRHLDATNQAPAYVLWTNQAPHREPVRAGLAAAFGCDPEELAITRNASESLQILQFGIDLAPGDEVLTTTQDYPRMLTTFEQRARRERIVLRQIEIPVPAEDPREIVRRFEAALTPKTKLILASHCINLTGQIMPIAELGALARSRGLPLLVDGAHAFAQIPFTRDQLNCDFYATSLHKWLNAPIGAGFLYVRRNQIPKIWPLMAAPDAMQDNIRKFEEVGTHPAANFLAIADALTFHHGIGIERKSARLRYLRDRWALALREHKDVMLHTSLDPRFSCAIGCVQLRGIDTGQLQKELWSRHRIFTTMIKHAQFEGLRITAGIYTTIRELDRFVAIMRRILTGGLAAA